MTTKLARDLVPGDLFVIGGGIEKVMHPTQEWLWGKVTIHVQDCLMIRMPATTEVTLKASDQT